METTLPADGAKLASPAPTMSVFSRAVAIFTRPAQAWDGLRDHAQWWFPMLIMVIMASGFAAGLHHRAFIPMMSETWDQKVQAGEIPAEQVDKMERFFTSPAGLAVSVGQQVVFYPILTLVIALLVWFTVGFVLGTKFRYRLALEVACWSALVSIPSFLISFALAWTRQTMKGVHTGFGILLPDSETPSRLMMGLGAFLDFLGPLQIWYLVVGILGAAALSGASRKSAAWALGTMYLVIGLFVAALSAMFAPTA